MRKIGRGIWKSHLGLRIPVLPHAMTPMNGRRATIVWLTIRNTDRRLSFMTYSRLVGSSMLYRRSVTLLSTRTPKRRPYPMTRQFPFGRLWMTGDQFSNGGGTETVSVSSHWKLTLSNSLYKLPEMAAPTLSRLSKQSLIYPTSVLKFRTKRNFDDAYIILNQYNLQHLRLNRRLSNVLRDCCVDSIFVFLHLVRS